MLRQVTNRSRSLSNEHSSEHIVGVYFSVPNQGGTGTEGVSQKQDIHIRSTPAAACQIKAGTGTDLMSSSSTTSNGVHADDGGRRKEKEDTCSSWLVLAPPPNAQLQSTEKDHPSRRILVGIVLQLLYTLHLQRGS